MSTPEERARSRVLVHHPGSNHLAYQLVAALQGGGYDASFETGFFYTPDGVAARLARLLPGGLRGKVERELKRRSHAGVDPCRLVLRPLPELAYVGLSRGSIAPERLARVVGWRNDVMDRAVARSVRHTRPRAVIGHDGSALFAARAAKEVGVLAVLNQVVGHVSAALEMFQAEAAAAPEFAETMPALPESIVARHEAEIAEADHIVVPSDYVRDTLIARGAAAARISVIPYGVDIARFHPGPPRPPGRFRILFVGTLSQRKGIRYLLEAVKRLKLPNAELVLAGRLVGSEAAFAPYRDVFRHVTHVPYHEVHALYQDADLFVYPSLHEGSAFAVFEALASGLPVICTSNTGSVVRDGIDGFLVPVRDVEALMSKTELLYRDRDLRESFARNARTRAEDFTWARYGERLNALMDRLLS
jgi:alpha-maltose-1-phosphate synthase